MFYLKIIPSIFELMFFDCYNKSMNYKALVESIIFSSASPITIEKIAKISDLSVEEVKEIISLLERQYSQEDSGIYLGWTLGGYKFLTKPQYNKYIQRLNISKERNVREEYLEIISIIALKQPINRRELEEIIGSRLDNTLKTIYKLGLVRRERVPGKRGYSYFTSKKFFKLLNVKNREAFLKMFR